MKKKTVFTAAAIVAGNGIGSGVMAIPYFVSKVGVLGGAIAFLTAYIISVLLHLMIARIMLTMGETLDILGAFNVYLFRGRFKNVFKIALLAPAGAMHRYNGMFHKNLHYAPITLALLAAYLPNDDVVIYDETVDQRIGIPVGENLEETKK